MTRACRRGGEGGFALAETLIATMIIAVMLGVFFQSLSTTSRASALQQGERRSALLAASILARIGADIALAPGTTEGNTDGLDWHVEIDPYRPGSAGGIESRHLLRISVSVASALGGRVAVQSVRFAS